MFIPQHDCTAFEIGLSRLKLPLQLRERNYTHLSKTAPYLPARFVYSINRARAYRQGIQRRRATAATADVAAIIRLREIRDMTEQ